MNSLDQQRRLVERLAQLTEESRLQWESDVDGEPFALLGGYFVNLKEGRSASGATIYKVVIEDKDQKIVDSFDDEDIDEARGGKYFALLREATDQARRKSKGADKAIENILKTLDELDQV